MINKTKIAEIKIVAIAAQHEADRSGTFKSINLDNIATALREVASMDNLTMAKVAKLVKEARKVAAGRADTMGRYEGYCLAQKILLR